MHTKSCSNPDCNNVYPKRSTSPYCPKCREEYRSLYMKAYRDSKSSKKSPSIPGRVPEFVKEIEQDKLELQELFDNLPNLALG